VDPLEVNRVLTSIIRIYRDQRKNVDTQAYIDAKLTHSIHTSERMSFRGCRRRWNWVFNDRYYPTTTAKPLEFGSAFHKAMETWYDPMMWGKDSETRTTLAVLAFINTCNEQKAKFFETTESNTLDPEVEEDYNERIVLGEGMIRYHCAKVSPTLDKTLTPTHVEIEFEVPVTNPDNGDQLWCKCDQCWKLFKNHTIENGDGTYEAGEYQFRKRWNLHVDREARELLDYGQDFWVSWDGLPVTYGGRIDCLMKDQFNRLWLVDWKTAARLSGQEEGDTPDEFLQLEDQVTSYLWALWVLGIKCAGFIHHEIKKAFPEPPEPNKVQRKGCWYSVNKMQNTSYALYLETISEGDPSGLASGAYDEFLDYLKTKGPQYFSRKQVHRNETELINAGRMIYLEALDMTDPNLRLYPSPGRFGCNFCAYRQPCLSTNQGEDVEYLLNTNFEKRVRRYWEIQPASTDSKGGA
jgi:hypothetical protein